ncbi:MAG: hypothetical protein OSJ72_12845 [Lachnospiraceae bacterium]|nr:hypothetical protein [Lachnospiraceae bacterium]
MNESQDTLNLREAVNNLDICDSQWRDYFEQAFSASGNSDGEEGSHAVLKMIQELVVKIHNKQKQLIDDRNEEDEQTLFAEIRNILGETVAKKIEERNGSILEIYRNTRPLREAGEHTIPLIVGVFECASVNYVPGFIEKKDEYGIDEEEFNTLVLQLDRIISVHVERYYDKGTAQQEFMKVTGLDQPYGLVYAELFEKHFERLQHNICLDKLDDLSERIDDLSEQITELAKQISAMQHN